MADRRPATQKQIDDINVRLQRKEDLPEGYVLDYSESPYVFIASAVKTERTSTPPSDSRLVGLTRSELDERATALGIDDSESLPNKEAVMDAIQAAGGQ